MPHVPYVGNGPYCYANSFAMVMGERAPSTALIEVTTCGPFGMQLIALAGYAEGSAIAADQARLVGALQHPLVVRDFPKAAATLRELAPTYEKLRQALTISPVSGKP